MTATCPQPGDSGSSPEPSLAGGCSRSPPAPSPLPKDPAAAGDFPLHFGHVKSPGWAGTAGLTWQQDQERVLALRESGCPGFVGTQRDPGEQTKMGEGTSSQPRRGEGRAGEAQKRCHRQQSGAFPNINSLGSSEPERKLKISGGK